MTFSQFIVDYSLFLLIASLGITGFYIITRGEKSTQPDGTIKRKGKIFKGWSLYWERTTGDTRFYYTGGQLQRKYDWLRECNMGLAAKLSLAQGLTSLEVTQTITRDEMNYLRDIVQCELESNDKYVFLYLAEPQYYFPEWLRYPLSQCPPCMGSVYGTLFYWPVFQISTNDAFSWSVYPLLAAIFFWVIFCIALSALNKFFYNLIGP